MTKAQSDKIILCYLRNLMSKDTNGLSDQEVLHTWGGRKFNAIVADFHDGCYLYKSVEDTAQSMGHGRTIYSLIDTRNLADSCQAEEGDPTLSAQWSKAIIADHLRFLTNEERDLNDQRVIDEHGGDTSNKIIADFGNGLCIYRSIDSAITVYSLIDLHDPNDSRWADELHFES